jgi:hypothetical protein
VWVQDRVYFPELFPGYSQYRHETPMLIPTRESITKCLKTLHPARQGPIIPKVGPPVSDHEEGDRC